MTLQATLDATVDGDVTFAFAVENVGSDPVELTFRSGKTADVAVYEGDREGTPTWRWSDGRMFTMAVETEDLAPGERLSMAFEWSDPPPGEYLAVGTLEADRDAEATTEFAVE